MRCESLFPPHSNLDADRLLEGMGHFHRVLLGGHDGIDVLDQSRQQKAVVNDADRLRKFLHKFGLNWEQLKQPY